MVLEDLRRSLEYLVMVDRAWEPAQSRAVRVAISLVSYVPMEDSSNGPSDPLTQRRH